MFSIAVPEKIKTENVSILKKIVTEKLEKFLKRETLTRKDVDIINTYLDICNFLKISPDIKLNSMQVFVLLSNLNLTDKLQEGYYLLEEKNRMYENKIVQRIIHEGFEDIKREDIDVFIKTAEKINGNKTEGGFYKRIIRLEEYSGMSKTYFLDDEKDYLTENEKKENKISKGGFFALNELLAFLTLKGVITPEERFKYTRSVLLKNIPEYENGEEFSQYSTKRKDLHELTYLASMYNTYQIINILKKDITFDSFYKTAMSSLENFEKLMETDKIRNVYLLFMKYKDSIAKIEQEEKERAESLKLVKETLNRFYSLLKSDEYSFRDVSEFIEVCNKILDLSDINGNKYAWYLLGIGRVHDVRDNKIIRKVFLNKKEAVTMSVEKILNGIYLLTEENFFEKDNKNRL